MWQLHQQLSNYRPGLSSYTFEGSWPLGRMLMLWFMFFFVTAVLYIAGSKQFNQFCHYTNYQADPHTHTIILTSDTKWSSFTSVFSCSPTSQIVQRYTSSVRIQVSCYDLFLLFKMGLQYRKLCDPVEKKESTKISVI